MDNQELHQVILQRLDANGVAIAEIRHNVKEVEVHTRATNGRVTRLELSREREIGAQDERERLSRSRQWWLTACVTMASSSLCGVVVYFLSSH